MTDAKFQPRKIFYYANTFWGPAWYRCATPGGELQRLGHEVVLTDRLDDRVYDCDIFVALRPAAPEILRAVRHLNQAGKMTVFEIDDDYWNLAPDNPARRTWTADLLSLLSTIARECQLVTVSTPELAEIMRPMNREVRVLPNMLPDEDWPTQRKPVSEGGPLVLGWAGSPSHAADVRTLGLLFGQLMDEYPPLEVHLAGARADWVPSHERLRLIQPVQIRQYASILEGFDIGVAPLVDTRFNRCKSDLKFVEYAMIGLPVVASDVTPYQRAVRRGENGFLAKNAKDWLKYLRPLIEDASLRDAIGAKAREFAEKRLISANIERWEKLYGIR